MKFVGVVGVVQINAVIMSSSLGSICRRLMARRARSYCFNIRKGEDGHNWRSLVVVHAPEFRGFSISLERQFHMGMQIPSNQQSIPLLLARLLNI
jgi:hypothetical protein